jgi:hypothetical protein
VIKKRSGYLAFLGIFLGIFGDIHETKDVLKSFLCKRPHSGVNSGAKFFLCVDIR